MIIRSSETSFVEAPIDTVTRFGFSWQRAVARGQRIRVEEVVSIAKETHRLTDEYPFHLDDRGLYVLPSPGDPRNQERVYVRDQILTRGYPESAEAQVFERLEHWMKASDSGTAVWLSPAYGDKYPCSKIITHQIFYDSVNGEKICRNSAILFNAGEKEILQLVYELFPQTRGVVQNVEELRPALLFVTGKFDLQVIWEKIAILDPNVAQAKTSVSDEELMRAAKYIADLINNGVSGRQVAREMQQMGLLGRHSISCPPARGKGTAFSEMFGGLGSDHMGSLQFECPGCHKKLVRPYGQLIPNCYYCGVSVKC